MEFIDYLLPNIPNDYQDFILITFLSDDLTKELNETQEFPHLGFCLLILNLPQLKTNQKSLILSMSNEGLKSFNFSFHNRYHIQQQRHKISKLTYELAFQTEDNDLREKLTIILELVKKMDDYIFHRSSVENKRQKILDSIEYIKTNFSKPISLEHLYRQSKLSPATFHRMFKLETGQRPIEYIQKARINHAKRLLEKPSAKVHDIGSNLGFESSNYFIRTFKKYLGITPKQYQMHHRAIQHS